MTKAPILHAGTPLFMTFPDPITAMRAEGKYLIVDTTVKRYRLYERAGRKGFRRRLVGLLRDLA